MGQGKRMRRGSRHRVDLRDIAMTLFLSVASEEEIMAMSPRERRQAQVEGRRVREAPGYRSWGAESLQAWSAWQRSTDPGKIWNWFGYLDSIGRRDLGRDITREGGGFTCGKCGQFCDVPYCVPNEPKWLCKTCTAGRPAQPGRFRPRRGAYERFKTRNF